MDEDFLVNADGTRRYETVAGIPILLPDDVDATHSGYMQIREENRRLALAAGTIADREIDEFLDGMIVPTCGNLFHGVRLRGDYPLGEMPEFARSPVLEIGCNWGRWAIGGARKGMRVIGVDIHLKSLLCASHLAKKLAPQNKPLFVVADARRLPLADGSMGGVFSYSVLQHFSQENCASILSEVRRVMSPNSRSVIQMAHSGGIRARIAKRAGPDSEFDVRRYPVRELTHMFERQIGPSQWKVDCFLGLNVHARDWRFAPPARRGIIAAAEILQAASRFIPHLRKLSDSVFVESVKTRDG